MRLKLRAWRVVLLGALVCACASSYILWFFRFRKGSRPKDWREWKSWRGWRKPMDAQNASLSLTSKLNINNSVSTIARINAPPQHAPYNYSAPITISREAGAHGNRNSTFTSNLDTLQDIPPNSVLYKLKSFAETENHTFYNLSVPILPNGLTGKTNRRTEQGPGNKAHNLAKEQSGAHAVALKVATQSDHAPSTVSASHATAQIQNSSGLHVQQQYIQLHGEKGGTARVASNGTILRLNTSPGQPQPQTKEQRQVFGNGTQYGQTMQITQDTSGKNVTVASAPKSPPCNITNHTIKSLCEWEHKLKNKMASCLKKQKGGMYLYHSRKAAGTTLRDQLKILEKDFKIPLFEMEGSVLSEEVMKFSGVVTVTSLRDPVDRIVSMYWYDHVAWWGGVKKDKGKLRSFASWVSEWRDSSQWKRDFMLKNPFNVYLEIENYFVKIFSGWKGPGPVGESDLAKAKKKLQEFDVVVVSEYLSQPDYTGYVDRLFEKPNFKVQKTNSADKDKFVSMVKKDNDIVKIAGNFSEAKTTLRQINELDYRLYKWAQGLMHERYKYLKNSSRAAFQVDVDYHKKDGCDSPARFPPKGEWRKKHLGLHQPEGHKH